MWADYKSNRYN